MQRVILVRLMLIGMLVCTAPAVQAQVLPIEMRAILIVEGKKGSNDWLGTGLYPLGDVNGDSWPDFAVSARGREQTLIYYGGPGILDAEEDLVLHGGEEIAGGDLNGDGVLDLVIHRRERFIEEQDTIVAWHPDSVFVYLGRSNVVPRYDTLPTFRLGVPPVPGTRYDVGGFGNSMAVGDINNDGFDDLVICAMGYRHPDYPAVRGRVYIYYGKTVWIPMHDVLLQGSNLYERFGSKVIIGDTNGDEVDDLIIATARGTNTPLAPDWVEVKFFHGMTNLSLDVTRPDALLNSRDYFKWYEVSDWRPNFVDLTNDGILDLYLPRSDTAVIYVGSAEGYSPLRRREFLNPDPYYVKGFTDIAVNIGDVDNSSYDDYILVGRRGSNSLLLYMGGFLGIKDTVAAVGSKSYDYGGFFGTITSPVGDVDGDGYNDFCATAPCDASLILHNNWDQQRGTFILIQGRAKFTVPVDEAEEAPIEMQVEVYPSPSTGSMDIRLYAPAYDEYSVELYDSNGRLLGTVFHGALDAGYHGIDVPDGLVSALRSGVYWIAVRSKAVPAAVKRVVHIQ